MNSNSLIRRLLVRCRELQEWATRITPSPYPAGIHQISKSPVGRSYPLRLWKDPGVIIPRITALMLLTSLLMSYELAVYIETDWQFIYSNILSSRNRFFWPNIKALNPTSSIFPGTSVVCFFSFYVGKTHPKRRFHRSLRRLHSPLKSKMVSFVLYRLQRPFSQ